MCRRTRQQEGKFTFAVNKAKRNSRLHRRKSPGTLSATLSCKCSGVRKGLQTSTICKGCNLDFFAAGNRTSHSFGRFPRRLCGLRCAWGQDHCQKHAHRMTTMLPTAAASNEEDQEEETCPVCYEPNNPPAGDAPTSSVACEVCKHAVCGECDAMLTQAAHVQCPMCRAPRRPRALPFSMCQKCRVFAVP